jgi:cell division protein FtsN
MAKDYAKATFNTKRARRQKRLRRALFFIFLLGPLSMGMWGGWVVYQQGMLAFNKEKAMSWVDEFKTLLHRHPLQVVTHQNIKMGPTGSVPQRSPVRFDFYTELPNMQVTLPNTQDEAGKDASWKRKSELAAQNEAGKDASWKRKSELAAQNEAGKNANGKKKSETVVQNESGIIATKALENESGLANEASKNNPVNEQMDSTFTNSLTAPAAAAIQRSKDVHSKTETHYVVQVGAYKSDSTASEMRISILLAGFDVKVVKTTVGDHVIYRIQQGPYRSLDRAKIIQKQLQAKGFEGVIQKIS